MSPVFFLRRQRLRGIRLTCEASIAKLVFSSLQVDVVVVGDHGDVIQSPSSRSVTSLSECLVPLLPL